MTTDLPAGFELLPAVDGFINHVGPIYVRWSATPRRATARRESEDASALLGAGTASLGFRVAPEHGNPAGIYHGGMLMTVMDMGIAVALKAAARSEKFLPTINLGFDFLAPAQIGAWLESHVDFTFTTPRMGFAHGLLLGPDGPVLRANGIMKIPSDSDPRFLSASRKVGSLRDA